MLILVNVQQLFGLILLTEVLLNKFMKVKLISTPLSECFPVLSIADI